MIRLGNRHDLGRFGSTRSAWVGDVCVGDLEHRKADGRLGSRPYWTFRSAFGWIPLHGSTKAEVIDQVERHLGSALVKGCRLHQLGNGNPIEASVPHLVDALVELVKLADVIGLDDPRVADARDALAMARGEREIPCEK